MKLFFTKKQLAKYNRQQVEADRVKFMEGTARNGATAAVHSIVCMRPISEWRRLLDEAEKSGNKYRSLAELIIEAKIKR